MINRGTYIEICLCLVIDLPQEDTVPLERGVSLGPYEILAPIGAGGMGEVYRARDARLGRDVAIKILPSETVANAQRKERFIQEARAASALSHPNIVTIYDIGSEDGNDFIAMEYVAGKTLDELIPRKGMRLNTALRHAVQVADALTAAHEAGIVHRDLKPGNIIVGDDGRVRVLDFGLAKLAVSAEVAIDDETRTVAAPRTGDNVILGTPCYMSPEQVEGRSVDSRSDIFSFGSVLYEMLGGDRPFHGDSGVTLLAAILKEEPAPLAADIPRDITRVVHRCLRKDPAKRFQHADDLKVALEELVEESDSGSLGGTQFVTRSRNWPLAVAALAVLIVAAVIWVTRSGIASPEPALVEQPLTSFPGFEASPTFSPDGNRIAYSRHAGGAFQQDSDIFVTQIGSAGELRLTENPATEIAPAWSPDDRYIAFFRMGEGGSGTIILISPLGGPERVLCEVRESAAFPTLRQLSWSPDAQWLAFSDRSLDRELPEIHAISIEAGERRRMTTASAGTGGDCNPAFSPDGRHLAYVSHETSVLGGKLLSVPLSDALMPAGEPTAFGVEAEEVLSLFPVWNGNREIIYIAGQLGYTRLFRVSLSKPDQPQQLPVGPDGSAWPAISHRTSRLVYGHYRQEYNIWEAKLPGDSHAFDPAETEEPHPASSTHNENVPVHSPDGRMIAFASTRSGSEEIWACSVDGSDCRQMTNRGGPSAHWPQWSPDGGSIAFHSGGNPSSVKVINLSGGEPQTLVESTKNQRRPSWSRDGRWIYYVTDLRVFRVPIGGGEPVQLAEGGTPKESADGKRLYYVRGQELWMVPTGGGTESLITGELATPSTYAPAKGGVYFGSRPVGGNPLGKTDIYYLDDTTGQTSFVRSVRQYTWGLSVSPDERSLLYCRAAFSGSDLVLVENFK
jgi:eukaryotic-like serine/threonine-protein kinase